VIVAANPHHNSYLPSSKPSAFLSQTSYFKPVLVCKLC